MVGRSKPNNEAIEGVVVHHQLSPETPEAPKTETPITPITVASSATEAQAPSFRVQTPPQSSPSSAPKTERFSVPIAPMPDEFLARHATRRTPVVPPLPTVASVPLSVRTAAPTHVAPRLPRPEIQPPKKSRRVLAFLGAVVALTTVAAVGKVGFDRSGDARNATITSEGTPTPGSSAEGLESVPTITAEQPEATIPIVIPTSRAETASPDPAKVVGQNSTQSAGTPTALPSSSTHARVPLIIIPQATTPAAPRPSVAPQPSPQETVTPVNPTETSPSSEAINLLATFVDTAQTQTLRENYQGVDDALNFDALQQSGEIDNIQTKDIDNHQKLTKQLYANPNVSSRLGTIAWLSENSLRANRANGDSPALQLLAQTDNVLRGAQSVYPYTGDAIASLPFINRDYTHTAKAHLQAGENLWVPDAQNAFVAAVHVVRLSDGSSAAFAAVAAQYGQNGQPQEVISWKLLEPTTNEGQFTAVTVALSTLTSNTAPTPEQTPTPDATPTDTTYNAGDGSSTHTDHPHGKHHH